MPLARHERQHRRRALGIVGFFDCGCGCVSPAATAAATAAWARGTGYGVRGTASASAAATGAVATGDGRRATGDGGGDDEDTNQAVRYGASHSLRHVLDHWSTAARCRARSKSVMLYKIYGHPSRM